MPTIYRSTDASAPVLSGTVGSLVALLDACLVTGYGAKPAAGWTKPFTGTNSASFKMGGGTGFYIDVNDNGPGAGTAKEARMRGFETMTALATGTGPFPTVAQLANGLFVRKSTTADATARPWIIFADDEGFLLFLDTGDAAGNYFMYAFGDVFSWLPGDVYRCLIIGRTTENTGTDSVAGGGPQSYINYGGGVVTIAGHFMARGYTGLGGSAPVGKNGDATVTNEGNSVSPPRGAIAYPNPPDGTLLLSRIHVIDNVTAPVPHRRGYMRGLYHYCHPITNIAHGDTFDGVAGLDYAGRSFTCIKTVGAGGGVWIVETTAWDSSA